MAIQAKALKELSQLLDENQVISNPVELITYEIDAALERGKPDVVVIPQSAHEVCQILSWAGKNGIPVIGWGAGTGLAGAAVAENGGMVVVFSHMNRLLEFDPRGRSVVVEPGLVNQQLGDIAGKHAFTYPPDPASGRSSTIGGNIAANAGGPHCFKYGVTTNYVTGIEFAAADGQLLQLGGRALDYPEYDFTGILTGSEGTLGLFTKAYLRLIRKSPGIKTMMAAFETGEEAGQAVSDLIANGLVPATMEFMDQKLMRTIEEYIDAGLPVHAGAALIIEVDGYHESLSPQMNEIETILNQRNPIDIHTARTPEEREKIWYGRKGAAGAMARLAPAYLPLDVTVPRSKLAQTIARVNHICTQYELRAAYICHAGDGNLHPLLLIEEPHNPIYMERVHKAGGKIMEISGEFDGTITGEHGVGIEKREYMSLMYSNDELQAMWEIKTVFDPANIMNPGKVFPKLTKNAGHDNKNETLRPLSSFPNDLQPEMHPHSEGEISAIFQKSALEKTPLAIRGSGTKSGPTHEIRRVLFTKNLSGVIEIAPDDLFVNVPAGTTIHELQSELADHNMWVPVISPWKTATLGGIAAANFNSPLRMRYGGLRDLVLAMKVILPDGRLIRAGRPVVKNVAGYDLTKLFVGSQGTLGLITELSLKLVPLPRWRSSIIFPCDDLDRALNIGADLLQVCLVASALLLCRGCIDLTGSAYHLVYTAEGYPENVSAELSQVKEVLETHGINTAEQTDSYSGSEIWSGWVYSQPQLFRFGIPPKSLGIFINGNAQYLDSIEFIADIANGLIYTAGPPDSLPMVKSALKIGGYALRLSGENLPDPGVGLWTYQPDSQVLMRRLKKCWDPENILNPGSSLPL